MFRGRWLLLLVAAGAAAAAIGLSALAESDDAPTVAHAHSAPLASAHPPRAPASDEVAGTVLEHIDVARYTYLRLDTPNLGQVWTAVPTTPTEVGQRVRVVDAQRQVGFTSHTLRRAFDVIYFGRLAGSSGSTRAPHPPAGPHASGPNPHHGAGGPPVSGPSEPIARAAGPLGRTVAQVHADRRQLAGKRVRVRGVVVRSTAGVMGRSFIHLQDGSGSAAQKNHDLTVTTKSQPGAGRTFEFEGTVAVDRDFGAGYRYDVIVEDAHVIFESDGAQDG